MNPQRSVAHTGAIIFPDALRAHMQLNSSLPDAVVADVSCWLKDCQAVDKMKM